MKTMKNSMKCFIAMFIMAMAFVVTGITSEAAATGLQQTADNTTSVRVSFTPDSKYSYYSYQIATNAAFTSILKQGTATSSYASITGLTQGSTYYVRIGCGTTSTGRYANWSSAIQVVTTPGALSDIKFTSANDTTATISYAASGANIYYIYDYDTGALLTSTTNTSIALNLGSAQSKYLKVIAARKSAAGYIADTYSKYKRVYTLTTKIPTSNFGLNSVLSSINEMSVTALYSGNGFQVQLVNAGGTKYSSTSTSTKSYLSNGSTSSYFAYKQNKYLKYRVRAYVNTDNGIKYGSWSDYRAFCEMNVKYTRGSKKINFKWTKIAGTGKIRASVSTKQKTGYKTFKTLAGTKKSVSVTKYGKTALKKNKNYYFRIVPLVKIGSKYVASDYYGQQKIKVK